VHDWTCADRWRAVDFSTRSATVGSDESELTTFSLRGRTTPSFRLSTSASDHTAARTVREILHEYPPFRATDSATNYLRQDAGPIHDASPSRPAACGARSHSWASVF
jgi:hypothetical protein